MSTARALANDAFDTEFANVQDVDLKDDDETADEGPIDDETEAPADDASTASEDDTSDSTEDTDESGQPRDPKGRFAATNAEGKEIAPPVAKAAPVPDPNAIHASKDPAAKAAEAPFTFRSMGSEIPIEGAVRRQDGSLVVPAAALPTVQQLLSRGHEFHTSGRQKEAQYQSRIKELETKATQPTLREKQLETVYGALAQIFDDPEELADYAMKPEKRALLLERLGLTHERVALDYTKQMGEQRAKTETATADTQREAVALTNAVKAAGQRIEGVTPQDIEAATAYFEKIRPAVIRGATAEEAEASGGTVKEGERVVVDYLIDEYLEDRATRRKQEAEIAKKAEAAARFNSGVNGKKPAPVPAKRPAAKGEAPKQPTSRDAKRELATWMRTKAFSEGDTEDE